MHTNSVKNPSKFPGRAVCIGDVVFTSIRSPGPEKVWLKSIAGRCLRARRHTYPLLLRTLYRYCRSVCPFFQYQVCLLMKTRGIPWNSWFQLHPWIKWLLPVSQCHCVWGSWTVGEKKRNSVYNVCQCVALFRSRGSLPTLRRPCCARSAPPMDATSCDKTFSRRFVELSACSLLL